MSENTDSLRILIIQPGYHRTDARGGNFTTALRWKRMLKTLGHRVRIDGAYTGQKIDVLIALHAQKSARWISQCAKQSPQVAIVVALTGTDIYGDLRGCAVGEHSLDLATAIVVLQGLAEKELAARYRNKTHVIHQSCEPPLKANRLSGVFEVCVCGHMRDVKDPMRTAMAIRRLPKASRIRVKHIGGIIESKYRERVEREQKQNNRYEWLGELSPKMTHREIAKSHLLVVSSRSEGGANVVSEAIVAGTPVVSTRIPGSIGLLGENYQGYFSTANTKELRQLLLRSEVEAAFYRKLRDACEAQRPLFAPERERAALKELIQSLMG